LKAYHIDLKEVKPKLIDRLGKRMLHEFKHKAKPKATSGNLMNLLDLAKSNRADN
jgi:hypothetical protein